ncbi:uncharacterized protein LOC141800335 [Halichoeres trimaculatus]|uniref:uncharacterized protein LOC141800335 n=1 Tax=Halichoeres trimaculatus TaxID=147232 RepID=UPI003D9DE956
MSVEYTIDIQLTELGFLTDSSDSRYTSQGESPTSPGDSSLASHPPTTHQGTYKQQLLLNGHQAVDGKESGAVKQNGSFEESAVDLTPAQRLPPEQDKKLLQKPVVVLTPLTPRPQQLKQDQITGDFLVSKRAARKGSEEEKQSKEDDSDDSDVSGVYEDDEEDEEDEEEEEPNESGQPGDYSCSVCGLELPSKFKLQDHMNLHTGARPYGCAECGKRFCQISSYRAHLRTHAQSVVKRFECRVCHKGFSYQKDLKCHVALSHWEDTYYECDQCKRVFTCLKACQSHVLQRECLQNTCEKCGRNFSSPEPLARHRKKPCLCIFKCTDCKKTFTKKIALLKHSFSHLGLLPYTCVRCHCHFRLARLYLKHKCEPERIHCLACLREFPSEKDFQQHKKDTGCWGGREPKGDEIRCMECGERFDTSDELKKHAGAHQRVLKCAECSKGFRSALLLMSHMGGHAGNSPCLCQACGLGFPHQQNYDSHLKTCGQTPPPKNPAKKCHVSKRSSSNTTSLNTEPGSSVPKSKEAKPESLVPKRTEAKPDSPLPKRTEAKPDSPLSTRRIGKSQTSNPGEYQVITVQTNRKNKKRSAAPVPVHLPHHPGPVMEGLSAGVDPSSGVWKLTLDRPLDPVSEIVLFLPVCATQANGLALPSVIPQSPAAPALQVQSQVAFPLVTPERLGESAALGQNAPLGMVTGIKEDPISDLPFDLSMKSARSRSALSPVPLNPVKSELEEVKISVDANNSEGQTLKNSYIEPYHQVKRVKTDPMDLSTSSGLITDIKKEAW